jgi:uncharacterized FAD-dependent dehydrogenase
MIRINQLKLHVVEPTEKLRNKSAAILKINANHIRKLEILRRSIDARKKPEIYFSYTVLLETDLKDEAGLVRRLRNRDVTIAERMVYQMPELHSSISGVPASEYFKQDENRPIVVGFGPAGMFAALILAHAGARPIIYERGATVEERIHDVEDLWQHGTLHPESNPQFGEGGAGTFSDGKLNTLTKDKSGRNRYVLEKFIAHGADPEILIDAKPHVGTDQLVGIVRGIRKEIQSLGGEFHFHTKFTYHGEQNVILAIGHSSRDTYEELLQAGLHMEGKDFAMGFRVQHPQEMINDALYGKVDEATLKALGPGAYKLTHTAESGRAVYSFCMCPGGYVVNSSSEPGRLCINGMSYHARDGRNANAAIIVSIRKEDYHGDADPLGGLKLQRELEAKAYRLADGKIPMERYGRFKTGKELPPEEIGISPAFRGLYQDAELKGIFQFSEDSPFASLNDVNASFIEGMESFAHQIPGFNRPDTILAGIEARTSSPVRIPRDENLEANLHGIYPCGEGAGYAGGITSAAMDGMKAAEALVKHYNLL